MTMPLKKISWTLEDLIDLEYFLYQDEHLPDGPEKEQLQKNERKNYIDTIEPQITGHRESERKKNKSIIRMWLDYRRNLESRAPYTLPGDIYKQAYAFTVFLFIILGFCTGSGLAFSFLLYQGQMPLNISSYLAIFVLSQLVLLLFVFLYLVLRRYNAAFNHFSLIRLGIYALVKRLIHLIKKRSENKLSEEKKLAFQSALGVIRGKSRLYAGVFPWPLFALTQIFAVFFNIGILTATLLRVVGTDLAFGWQSTLQLSSIAIYKAVTIISTPWSWIIPKYLAHPSLAQIEGSRIILKDGVSFLSTPDLIAWWPFLCFSVLTYGLLPRLMLLTGCSVMKRSALNRLQFKSISFDKLIRRLSSPCLDTHGENGEASRKYLDLPVHQSPERDHESIHPLVVLVPEDISDICHDEELSGQLNRIMGSGLDKKISVSLHMEDDKAIIRDLVEENLSRIVLVLESWQAPIREITDYIQSIMAMFGPDFLLYILFIGRPSDNTIFTPSNDHELLIWKQKISALANPNISIEVIPTTKPTSQNGTSDHA